MIPLGDYDSDSEDEDGNQDYKNYYPNSKEANNIELLTSMITSCQIAGREEELKRIERLQDEALTHYGYDVHSVSHDPHDHEQGVKEYQAMDTSSPAPITHEDWHPSAAQYSPSVSVGISSYNPFRVTTSSLDCSASSGLFGPSSLSTVSNNSIRDSMSSKSIENSYGTYTSSNHILYDNQENIHSMDTNFATNKNDKKGSRIKKQLRRGEDYYSFEPMEKKIRKY